MKLTLHTYIAQPKKGLYEASIPWIAELAEPIRGPSPAQLKEQLVFKVLDLVHGGMPPAELDRLIPPSKPYVTSIYLEIDRKVDPERPSVNLSTTTHAVIGGWPGDDLTRFWLPRAPGVCLVARGVDDMYAVLRKWVEDWADARGADDLKPLDCHHVAGIDRVEIDLGFPSPVSKGKEEDRPGGRLSRPQTLLEVATNLSHRAEDDALMRAYGREKIVDELVEAMTSPNPFNLCLVGPPGVGKTAVVHEAASRTWDLTSAYQERCDVWQTNGDRIIAGMSVIGQWEQRTEAMCRELTERQDVLYAEDLLGLVRAGRTYQGDSNVARFIEPYLEQERFAVITEATEETFALARSKAPGFVDKFRRVQVPELSYKETLAVINELIRTLEAQNGLRFTADGVETILHLTRRFFRREAYPGKAVRLVKQCQHEALRIQNEAQNPEEILVDPRRVAQVIQRQTGLPMTILRPGEGRTPDEIRTAVSSRVFGQPDAVDAVTSLVLAIEQGLTDPEKPLGSFLLIGPSGVGKTETAKTLAADLFGSEDRLIRFDMSEFSGAASVSRLIGTSRHPDGELTGKVRLQPFCVLLFDEVEKAHPRVLDLLLQLLGDGRLTDATGRTVDFHNALVIMTSNLGAASEDRWLGFSETGERDRSRHYRAAAESFFRPELFNRIDNIVPYRPLGSDALRRIARRTLQHLLERRGLRQAQVMIDVDEALIDYLAKGSVDPRYGARTLAHQIERQLITPLARKLTETETGEGLTRVSILPAESGVELRLDTIEEAPTTDHEPPRFAESFDLVDSDEVVTGCIEELADEVQQLADDPRVETVEVEYDSILSGLNEIAAEGGEWPPDLAQRLRQRETFLDRLENLQRRIQGLMDPQGTGELVLATSPEKRKAQTHRWWSIAGEIEQQRIWLEIQLDDLQRAATGESTEATLVVSGLSGPYGELIARFHRWLEALSGGFALELAFAYRADEDWVGDTARPEDLTTLTAFAASGDAPGLRAVFETLAGYFWSPQLPSHGQHALILSKYADTGTSDASDLLTMVREGIDVAEQRPYVEFIMQNGQLRDVRLERIHPIPEDRADNLAEFFGQVVVERLGG